MEKEQVHDKKVNQCEHEEKDSNINSVAGLFMIPAGIRCECRGLKLNTSLVDKTTDREAYRCGQSCDKQQKVVIIAGSYTSAEPNTVVIEA